MADTSNKIKFGLSNVYYAPITATADGVPTYGTPVRIPGAVSLSFSASGSSDAFYADNIKYVITDTNAGYEGDLEVALIPDSFKTSILGETKDTTNGIVIENSDTKVKEFALLFQIEGDASARRFCMWRCSATRPNVEGQTKEDKTEPKTEKLTITAMAREDTHDVKCYASPSDTAYSTWFTAVPERTPVAEPSDPSGT